MRTTEDRVVIRVLPKEEISAGGVIIPDSANGKPTKAEVLMIGDSEKIRVRPGEHILHPEHAGFEFNVNGLDQKVIRWGDVQMILDPPEQKSAQQIIDEVGVAIISYQQKHNAGMTNEMLELDINGNKFYLQGNVLMPVSDKPELPVATVQDVSIGVGSLTGREKVSEIINDMNRTHGKS